MTLKKSDLLEEFRQEFILPDRKKYFLGNSLGPMPKSTSIAVAEEFKIWGQYGVDGYFKVNPASGLSWVEFNHSLSAVSAELLDCKTSEVVWNHSLTTNLHLMMMSFYRPTKKRFKILVEKNAFSSDYYAIDSHLELHGLLEKKNEVLLEACNAAQMIDWIDSYGDEMSLVLVGNGNYFSGEVFDMSKITRHAHQRGALVGFDLAHGFGNLNFSLRDVGCDFAVFCGYKYLNGGPGSPGGYFVHERHHGRKLFRLNGWWGNQIQNRFLMKKDFDPEPDAKAWQLSNVSIFHQSVLLKALELFKRAGMDAIGNKRQALVDTFFTALKKTSRLQERFECVTPKESLGKTSQVSFRLNGLDSKQLQKSLYDKGVLCDFREDPSGENQAVVRVAFCPLYNQFAEVIEFVADLESLL